MLRKKITGAKYFSDATKQMTNLNIATPIDKKDTNFGSSDILLAKDVVKLANGTNSEDVDKLKTSIESINDQMTKITNDISTLNSKFTGLFEVVTELPNINDAQLGKIYCIKDTSSNEDDNKYIEWVKIKTADDTYKFEKVGEFKTEPDLSDYAKLDSPVFTGITTCHALSINNGLSIYRLMKNKINNWYLRTWFPDEASEHNCYSSDGGLADIGSKESFVFTLEDGSKVTKSIRVVSTTNS